MRILCLLTAAFAGAAPAAEREISLPVRLDDAYLREAFISQAFKDPGPSARVWDDGSGCNFMVISDPKITTRMSGEERLITVTTDSDARIGRRIGDRCVLLLDWSGAIMTTQTVELRPGGTMLRFRVVDSRIEDEEVRHGLRIGTLWEWVKEYVHPRLAAVRIDLKPALTDLRSVLQLVLPDQRQVLSDTLDSITLQSVDVTPSGLTARLGMGVPEQFFTSEAPVATLSAAELARFESAWQGWDGFVTFVVKHFAGGGAATPAVRRDLMDVLLRARYDLVEILAAGTEAREEDPVRALFVDTWSRLAPILRRLSAKAPGERGLQLLSFITAADALQTLDALGPRFNLDISVSGLRRLARILVPDSDVDPIIYDQGVDPELRQLFEFGPAPRPGDNTLPPQSRRRGLLPGLLAEARAAESLEDGAVSRLNQWVPDRSELDAYLNAVHRLLDETGREVAVRSDLDSGLQELYRVLVLATAWQETCWRQYQFTGEQIVPMRSPAGAVGMMQVVPTVWRGFYEPQGLVQDIAYNAVAGSEILMHYLTDYAIARGEHRQPGGRDNLAWATYAAYNGGPRHLRRYRLSSTRDALRAIDSAFRDKFNTIREGNELAVRTCYVD